MTISVQGTVTIAENASATSIAVNVPSGATYGEILVATVTHNTTTDTGIATPSGWILAHQKSNGTNGTAMFYRVVTGSETASYTFTGSATADRITGFMVRLSGVDLANPLDVAANNAANFYTSASSSTIVLPTVTTVTPDAFLMTAAWNNAATAATLIPPASDTQIATTTGTGRNQVLTWERVPIGGTATGTRTWTQNPTTARPVGAVRAVFKSATVILPYTETFTGTNGAALPAGWTLGGNTTGQANSAVTINNNRARATVNNADTYPTVNMVLNHTTTSDVDVTATAIPGNMLGQWHFIGIQSTGVNTAVWNPMNGYTLWMYHNGDGTVNVELKRYSAGAETSVVASQMITVANYGTTGMTARVQKIGTLIRFKVWAASASEPTSWTGTYTDTSPFNSGNVVLRATSNSGANVAYTTDWDNVSVSVPVSAANLGFVGSAKAENTGGSTTTTLTVPTGVNASHLGIISIASANSTAFTVTATGWTTRVAQAATNTYVLILSRLGGLVAGNTITITASTAQALTAVGAWYSSWNRDIEAVGTVTTRGGVSGSTITYAGNTITGPRDVILIGVDRTLTLPTISSWSPAAPTVDGYITSTDRSSLGGNITLARMRQTAAGVTPTYVETNSNGSTNALGVQFVIAEPAKAETFVEDFATAPVDSNKWYTASVISQTGRLIFPCDVGYNPFASTNYTYDLTGSSLFFEVNPAALDSNETYVFVRQANATGNNATFFWNGSAMGMRTKTNNVIDSVTVVNYSPMNHRYLRFRNVSDTIIAFEASPNATTWTELTRKTVTWSLAQCQVAVNTGIYDTAYTAQTAYLEGFNTTSNNPVRQRVKAASTANVTTLTPTLAAPATVGNVQILLIATGSGSALQSHPPGWTQRNLNTAQSPNIYVYDRVASATTDTSAAITIPSGGCVAYLMETSGISGYDTSVLSSGAGPSATFATGSLTPTSSMSYVIGLVAHATSATDSFGTPLVYANEHQLAGATNLFHSAYADLVTANTSAISSTITPSASVSAWETLLVAYKLAPAVSFIASYGPASISNQIGQTVAVTANTGDLLVLSAASGTDTWKPTITAAGGQTWTLRYEVPTGTGTRGYIGVWTATSVTTGTFNVTLTPSDSAGHNWIPHVQVWRNASFGAVASTANGGSAPSLAITTTAANSALSMAISDYNAVDGTTRAYRAAGTNFIETKYSYVSGIDTYYAGYYANAGAAGVETVGLTTPTGQLPSMVAIELLTVASGTFKLWNGTTEVTVTLDGVWNGTAIVPATYKLWNGTAEV